MQGTGQRYRELAGFLITEEGDIRESAYPFIREYLQSRCLIDTATQCWLWQGNKTGGKRYVVYGVVPSLGKRLAHRVSYEVFKGPIPSSLWVLHSCDVGLCINPEHLRVGTQTDNMQDMIQRGRANFGVVKHSITHCKHGHEFTPENTFISQGNRHCRECARKSGRESAKRRPDAMVEYTKAWRDANRERFNANAKEYQRKQVRQRLGLPEDTPDLRGRWPRKPKDIAVAEENRTS